MSISSISGGSAPQSLQDALASFLKAEGLSSDKASTIGAELDSVAQSVMSSSDSDTPADPASVRAALEEQLTEDVNNGTLTQEEADQVRAALDDFEEQMKANAPAGPPPEGEESAVSEDASATTDTDSDKSALDLLLESLKANNQGTDTTNAQNYLTQLLSQSVVDVKA